MATMCQMMAMNSVNVHIMPYLESSSVSMLTMTAATGVSVLSASTLCARIPFGFMADLFKKRQVMALSMALTAIGLVILQLMQGELFWMLVIFALVYGIGTAGATPLRVPIIREYFGVKNFGTIFGLMAVFGTIGIAGGAPLAGWVYDTYGTYSPIWFVYAGFCVVGIILILSIPAPPRGEASTRSLSALFRLHRPS
jgi:MFS family permease